MPASKAAKKATKKTTSKKAKQVDTPDEVVESTVTLDRRREDERRDGNPEALDTGVMSAPRRKKQRRRHIDPTTCERDYNNDEIEFMRAMDDYKRDSGRMFPTCSEVLEVVRGMGYVRLNDDQIALLQLEEFDATDENADDYDAEEAELEQALEG